MPHQVIPIGPVPCDEPCAYVGESGYDERSRMECRVFRRMLKRLFPLPDDIPARFVVLTFPHDFGAYREVCVRYDSGDARAIDHAYQVEANTPNEWDAIARYELIWIERQEQLQRALRDGELQPQELPEAYRTKNIPALPADRSFSELLAAFPL